MYKVNFYGFFSDFDKNDNFILDAIRKVGDVEISDSPDYVFYSVFDNEYLLYPEAIRVFFTGENVAPNFQLCDYAIGFERMNYGDRYLRYPFYYGMKSYKQDLLRANNKHQRVLTSDCERKFCSFVYSNADTDGARKELFHCLNNYQPVDAGGKLFNNINECVKDKNEFESMHKFSIACENSSHIGYCTEKILQAFGARTIPVYYGDASVNRDFNEAAFVNCHSYNSLNEAVEYVKYLNSNDGAYLYALKQQAFVTQDFIEQRQSEFEQFVANIFMQTKEKAYRRNRYFWGKKIDDKYMKIYKVEKFFRKLKKS